MFLCISLVLQKHLVHGAYRHEYKVEHKQCYVYKFSLFFFRISRRDERV